LKIRICFGFRYSNFEFFNSPAKAGFGSGYAGLGILCSGLAYYFWYSALEKRDSSIVGMYLYLEPFVTLIGAYFLLGEEILWITLLGGGMTLAGVYLATQKT